MCKMCRKPRCRGLHMPFFDTFSVAFLTFSSLFLQGRTHPFVSRIYHACETNIRHILAFKLEVLSISACALKATPPYKLNIETSAHTLNCINNLKIIFPKIYNKTSKIQLYLEFKT